MADTREYVSVSEECGSINISEDVIAVIAGGAAAEIEGVSSLFGAHGRDIAELSKTKVLAKSVRINTEDNSVRAELFILCDFGVAVGDVAQAVQSSVKNAVESATGIAVTSVNVHVCGISLKKD